MSKQTKLEKIELANKEIKSAEIMVESSRADLAKWINLLDMRREYLASIEDADFPIPSDVRANTNLDES